MSEEFKRCMPCLFSDLVCYGYCEQKRRMAEPGTPCPISPPLQEWMDKWLEEQRASK